jgi:uncharacterized protein (TIGR02145 family)
MNSSSILKLTLIFLSAAVIACNKDDENSASDNNNGNNNGGGNTSAAPHSCGAPNVHNASITYGTITDQEGNTYKTVVIDGKEWMAENLNTSIYRNGDTIAQIQDVDDWDYTASGAWCYPNNDETKACPYGKLYNHLVITDSRNVCPVGWHVSSDQEWSDLINYLDPTSPPLENDNYPNNAGVDLVSVSENPTQGTNSSGFSILLAGSRSSYLDSDFSDHDFGDDAFFWTSDLATNLIDEAWGRTYSLDGDEIERDPYRIGYGGTIRCVRD